MDEYLPSVEECRTFLDTINRGRAVVSLPELAKLEFDACEPSDGENCLSAHHLFAHAGLNVGHHHAWPNDDVISEEHEDLAHAIGAAINEGQQTLTIPRAIKAVTDPFDSCHEGLRERMIEAGVVDP